MNSDGQTRSQDRQTSSSIEKNFVKTGYMVDTKSAFVV